MRDTSARVVEWVEQRDHQNADIAAKIESDQRRQETPEPALSAHDAWRSELGGQTAYRDPNSAEGNVIYHRSGDQVVWMNEDEEIDGSEDPNHDPKIGSHQDLEALGPSVNAEGG